MIYDIDVGKLNDKDDKNNNVQYHLKICDSLDVIPRCLVTAPPPLPPALQQRHFRNLQRKCLRRCESAVAAFLFLLM